MSLSILTTDGHTGFTESGGYTPGYTVCEVYTVTQRVRLLGIAFQGTGSANNNSKAVAWSAGVKLSEGPFVLLPITNTQESPVSTFVSPVILLPGVTYRIGTYGSGYTGRMISGGNPPGTHSHGPLTTTHDQQYAAGDIYPSNPQPVNTYEIAMRLFYDFGQPSRIATLSTVLGRTGRSLI